MPQPPDTAAASGDLQQLQRKRRRTLRVGVVLGIALLLATDSAWRDVAPGERARLLRAFAAVVDAADGAREPEPFGRQRAER